MAKNPLGDGGKGVPYKSVFRAKEWAQMARDKGLKAHAEAWDRAHDDGWDEEHYDQLAAERYRRQIVESRGFRR